VRDVSDAVGLEQGLFGSCYMNIKKSGEGIVVDFTGTGLRRRRLTRTLAGGCGPFANYVYEYLFHDLPISNGTFAS